ncbi:MAG: Gfo/Idh/MocA family protein [Bryobacteraceae bacterium]
MNRRNFLHSTGAVSALALAQNSRGQTESKPVSANDRIQIGCIGFGIQGQSDMKTSVSIPGVQLVAVADVYEGRLTLAQERYGKDVFTSRDYREVLARPGLDAVIVATPDHWHARIACDAMKAGKDVYCEKPMVKKAEDGHSVVDTQKTAGRILQVGSQRVSSILYAKAKELIASGAIGEVHMIEAFWNRNSPRGAWQYSIPPDASEKTIDWDRFLGTAPKHAFDPVRLFRWRNYQDYGTGIPGDLFVHQFSGIHFVMNSHGPRRISAMGGTYFWKDGRDVPDLMMGMFDYPETSAHPGFQISLRVNFEAGSGEGSDSQGFHFVGTEGVMSLSVGNSLTVSKRSREGDPGTTAETFSKAMAQAILQEHDGKYPKIEQTAASFQPQSQEVFPLPRGYVEQTEHHKNFYRAIRDRTPVVEDPVFGLRAAGPALMSNVSYFERRTVQWDAEAMKMVS